MTYLIRTYPNVLVSYPVYVAAIRSHIEALGYTASDQDLDWAWQHYCHLRDIAPWTLPVSSITSTMAMRVVSALARISVPTDSQKIELSPEAFLEDRLITIDP